MNVADLERFEEFEHEWDLKLGGGGTRPFRELLAFTAARLRHCGASSADVVAYLQLLLEKFDLTAATMRGAS
jgi:hypothetical protein